MMKSKKNSEKIIADYDYLSSAASATEFTGLIPSLPQNEAELESYNDIWKFLPSVSPEAPVPRPSHENGRK